MFKRVVSRLTLGALLIASVTALVAATGGSADVGFVTKGTFTSVDPNGVACPGFSVNERHYCLVVTTYNNLKPSGGIEVDLAIQNFDQSTLNKPTATLTWANENANLSFVSANPSICTSPSAGQVNCAFPNLAGVGSASGPGVTPVSSTVKLFFSANATVPSVTFTGTGTAKESANDNTGAANVETQTVSGAVMTFDSNTGAGANEDATVALPKAPFNKPRLHTNLGNAFLDFFSGSSPAFIAQFAASSGVGCVLNVTCTGLDLNTDLSSAAGGTFSANNQILWTADVASTNTNILAVHTYDPVSITSSAPNTLTTAGTRFASCDGVTFSSGGTPSGLTPEQAYFVINATTTGATSTSFQVASSTTGKPLSFTGSGPFSGSCIRIIGDKPASESTKACTDTNPPAAPKTPPVLCVAKVPNSSPATVRAYLWDDANGHVGY
jgi:hypothetical protein